MAEETEDREYYDDLEDMSTSETDRFYKLFRNISVVAITLGILFSLAFVGIGIWRANEIDKLENKTGRQEDVIRDLEMEVAQLRAENRLLQVDVQEAAVRESLLVTHTQQLMIQLNAALGIPTANHTQFEVPDEVVPPEPEPEPPAPTTTAPPDMPDDPIHAGLPPGTPNPHLPGG